MRRALVVGIDNYPFGELTGCVADAHAVAALLERHADGSKNFDVREITDPPTGVDRPTLRQAVHELFHQPAEVALFYFSGHGSENNLGGYLVTPDARDYDEGVAMRDVIDAANHSLVSESIIIIDCCQSGHLGNVPAGPREANVRAELAEGVSILTATRPHQPAVESGGRGVFTLLLCSALDGGAADVLGDTKVASVYSYIDESLGPWEQRPLFKSHVSSLLSLRRANPSVSLEKLRRIADLFSSPDAELRLDPSFERTNSANKPSNVEVFDLLAAFRNSRLVEVVSHEHLYFAALESGSVRLTPLGRHYWQLVREGRL